MLRAATCWMVFVLMFLGPGSIGAITYHVAPAGDDDNPGTAQAPWRTLGRANATLAAGDTVLIHAGTYDEAIRPAQSGTSNTQRIVYRAAGDGEVILTAFPGTGDPSEGALGLGLRNYVTVSGRGPNDPPDARWIRLAPQTDVNSLGNVCGSEGVVVENIVAQCLSPDQTCNRGFGFCVGFWDGDYESRYNILRNSVLLGSSDPSQNPADYTEDIVTVAHRAHHNLIEGNVLSTCKHTALYADSPTSYANVIRGNTILNPQHTALSIWSAGVAFAEGARFLVEDNHLQASGDTTEPDGGPGNAFQWGSDELIIRYNVIERGGSADQQTTSIGGLMGATSTSFGQPYVATDSRIYNNTVVKNRGLALGLFDFGVQPVDLGRNRYVNNMFYGSNSAATGSLLAVYWDTDFATGDRFVGNVWGNPGGSTTTPIVQNAHQGQDDLATAVTDWRNPQDPELAPWHGFPNFYSADPGFVDYAGDDFRLAESSSYRDAGAPLTRVAASDPGTGTDLELEDTRFLFAEAAAFPAWMGVQPEHIAIGPTWASATRIAVTAVDDEAGTVTLARSIDRQVGDFVWLWRDSTGRQVVSGAGPDIGALESVLTLFTDGFETGDTTGWTTTVPLP